MLKFVINHKICQSHFYLISFTNTSVDVYHSYTWIKKYLMMKI